MLTAPKQFSHPHSPLDEKQEFLMTEETTPLPDGAVQDETQPQVGLLTQYVKDLSFENPNAPRTLQNVGQAQPRIEVNVNVGARRLGDEVFEVELRIEATARQEAEKAFQVELLYAGLFGIRNIPEETMEPFLIVEAPRLLFPFARRIIADATRDGGFPPLLLEPIDFAALYMQQKQNSGASLMTDNSGGPVGHA